MQEEHPPHTQDYSLPLPLQHLQHGVGSTKEGRGEEEEEEGDEMATVTKVPCESFDFFDCHSKFAFAECVEA